MKHCVKMLSLLAMLQPLFLLYHSDILKMVHKQLLYLFENEAAISLASQNLM